ncbi:MAG: helix-turn-helix domain-containing protein [Bacilli bacterium]
MVVHLFGDRLRELRVSKNLSQDDLGKILGVRKSSISNWETDKATPTYDILTKLAQYFSVTTDYLLGFNQDDLDKIERLKIACQEAGISIAGQDFTVEDFEKAMQVVEMLKEKKDEKK